MKTTNEDILRAALIGYQSQLDRVSARIAEITSLLTPRRGRKPAAKTAIKHAKGKHAKGKRVLSAQAKENIRQGQLRRRAKELRMRKRAVAA